MSNLASPIRSSSTIEEGSVESETVPLKGQKDEEELKKPESLDSPIVSSLGLKILSLLAIQNCFKNLLMRYVMKAHPEFLTSAAVIGVEIVKLILCLAYILLVDKRPLSSVYTFLRDDYKHSLLLIIPAAAYSFQMSMEYVALANLDAAMFSVLVQTKLLTTATFSGVILRTKFKYIQIISLVLLTTGVMLINGNQIQQGKIEGNDSNNTKGIMATLGKSIF
jgi:solute carrier family 35 (UDP-sugar transporter), member A1/2/3